MNAKILEKFEEMSLTRKFFVGFFALSTMGMLVEGNFFWALVNGVIAYFLIITSGMQVTDTAHTYVNDAARQQEEDDAYWMQKEEEERLAALNQQYLDESIRGWH